MGVTITGNIAARLAMGMMQTRWILVLSPGEIVTMLWLKSERGHIAAFSDLSIKSLERCGSNVVPYRLNQRGIFSTSLDRGKKTTTNNKPKKKKKNKSVMTTVNNGSAYMQIEDIIRACARPILIGR